jgi:lipid-A-disaccharide synthase
MQFYDRFRKKNVHFIQNQTYQLLNSSTMAMVTSGTATLETALFQVPQVVCYKSSSVSYFIAKLLVKIKFISLVNLILNKEVVRELIQQNCSVENIVKELELIRLEGVKRDKMLNEYKELIYLLGEKGASMRVAQKIWSEFG